MAEGNADFSSVLQKLLEDPDMLTRAMETAGKLKDSGLLDGLLPSDGKTETPRDTEAPASSAQGAYARRESAYIEDKSGKDRLPVPGNAASDEEARKAKQRKELLSAVRPFMSRERQERIDGILKILQLLELMQQFGINGIFP